MRLRLFYLALVLTNSCNYTFGQTLHLVPLTTFGPNGDGSLRPGDKTYLTTSTSPTERGLIYNPFTGHLLLVYRTDPNIYIIDGATGADFSTLDMGALSTGGNPSFKLNLIGIGDDGAIYAANLSNTDFPPVYNLYRWESETSTQQLVFNGTLSDVSNGQSIDASGYKRYGDTMAVRGAGTNTQVLIASRGTNAAILRPTDADMTNFVSTVLRANVPVGDMGFGLTFGPSNTFYATPGAPSGGPLRRLAFDLGDGTNGTATVLQTFSNTNFPGTVSALMVSVASNLLAGVDTIQGADLVRLYDLSNPTNPPVFLDRASFVTTNDNGQNAAALALGTNGVLYALEANNGIMAFNLVLSSAPVAPSVFLQPLDRVVAVGANVTFTTAADGTAPLSYQWLFNGTNILAGATNPVLTISNVQFANSGAYSLVVTNVAGSATSSPALLSVNSLIAYEPFNYTNDNQTITNQSNWYLTSTSTSDHADDGNLTYTALEPSRTNRLTWGSTSMSLRKPFGVTLNSGAIYYSFILRVDDVGGNAITGDTLAGFTVGTTTTFGTKLNLRTTANGGFNLGTSRAGTSPIVWAATEFTSNDVIFVVGRYTFVSGSANDVAEVWLNPSAADFGAASAPAATIANSTGTDNSTIDAFFVRSSGTVPPKKTVDELRLGLTWAAVTPPSALLSIANAGSNKVISWRSAALGYSLQKTTSLSASPNWTTVTNPVVVNGANNTVTVSNGVTEYFRLIK